MPSQHGLAQQLAHDDHRPNQRALQVVAATLMVQQGRLQLTDQQRIERLLEQFQLPTRAPMMSFDRWQTLLQRDKKVQAGTVRLVVPTAIGQAQVEPWSDWQAIQQAIVSMSSATAKTR